MDTDVSNHIPRFSQVVVANPEGPEIQGISRFLYHQQESDQQGLLSLSGEAHFWFHMAGWAKAIGQGPWLVFWQCTDKEAIQSSFIDVFDGRLSHDSCPSSSRDTNDTTWKKPFSTWVNEMLLDLSRPGAKNIGRTTGCCGSLTRSIAIYCIYFFLFLWKPTLTPRKPQFCHFPKLS